MDRDERDLELPVEEQRSAEVRQYDEVASAFAVAVRRRHDRGGDAAHGRAGLRLPARLRGGSLSSAQLAERLRISPAAVSGAVRYLSQVHMVSREREPGSRRELYRVHENVWYEALLDRDQILGRWAKTLRAGETSLGPDTRRGRPGPRHLRLPGVHAEGTLGDAGALARPPRVPGRARGAPGRVNVRTSRASDVLGPAVELLEGEDAVRVGVPGLEDRLGQPDRVLAVAQLHHGLLELHRGDEPVAVTVELSNVLRAASSSATCAFLR